MIAPSGGCPIAREQGEPKFTMASGGCFAILLDKIRAHHPRNHGCSHNNRLLVCTLGGSSETRVSERFLSMQWGSKNKWLAECDMMCFWMDTSWN